jgi:hypothetical protein
MIVNMTDYWPDIKEGDSHVTLDYNIYGGNTKRCVYTKKDRTIRLDEYTPPNEFINDAWEYVLDKTRGVVETGDWGANGSHVVYRQGKEILWGGVMGVGDKITNKIEIAISKSLKTFPFIGQYADNETTYLEFIPLFTDIGGNKYTSVVRIHNKQTFYNFLRLKIFGTKVYEVIRWHAPEIGVVQIDYAAGRGTSAGFQYTKQKVTT